MEKLKDKIEKYINKTGVIRTPAYFIKDLFNQIVDKLKQINTNINNVSNSLKPIFEEQNKIIIYYDFSNYEHNYRISFSINDSNIKKVNSVYYSNGQISAKGGSKFSVELYLNKFDFNIITNLYHKENIRCIDLSNIKFDDDIETIGNICENCENIIFILNNSINVINLNNTFKNYKGYPYLLSNLNLLKAVRLKNTFEGTITDSIILNLTLDNNCILSETFTNSKIKDIKINIFYDNDKINKIYPTYCFRNSTDLNSIYITPYIKYSNLRQMFYGCNSLQYINNFYPIVDVNFDYNNHTDVFNGCKSLKICDARFMRLHQGVRDRGSFNELYNCEKFIFNSIYPNNLRDINHGYINNVGVYVEGDKTISIPYHAYNYENYFTELINNFGYKLEFRNVFGYLDKYFTIWERGEYKDRYSLHDKTESIAFIYCTEEYMLCCYPWDKAVYSGGAIGNSGTDFTDLDNSYDGMNGEDNTIKLAEQYDSPLAKEILENCSIKFEGYKPIRCYIPSVRELMEIVTIFNSYYGGVNNMPNDTLISSTQNTLTTMYGVNTKNANSKGTSKNNNGKTIPFCKIRYDQLERE